MSAATVQSETSEVITRSVLEHELPFVLDSWVKSYQALMPGYAATYGMSRWDWTKHCAQWATSHAVVMVAVVEDYPEVILGWACADDATLHYAYTKSPLRRRGIATQLVEA